MGGVGLGTTGMPRCLGVWGLWVPGCGTGPGAVWVPWGPSGSCGRGLQAWCDPCSASQPAEGAHTPPWLCGPPRVRDQELGAVPFPLGCSPAGLSTALMEVHEPPGTRLPWVQHLAVYRAGSSQAILPDADTLSSWFSASGCSSACPQLRGVPAPQHTPGRDWCPILPRPPVFLPHPQPAQHPIPPSLKTRSQVPPPPSPFPGTCPTPRWAPVSPPDSVRETAPSKGTANPSPPAL